MTTLTTTRAAAFIALLVAALTALFQAAPAAAQDITGPYVEVLEERSGPYDLRVQMSPPRPLVGTVRVAVEVTSVATGQPVTDAVVRVYATPEEEGERQVTPALNSPAQPETYQGSLEVEHEGEWALEVEVEAPEGPAQAITEFEVFPRARSGENIPYGTALFVFITLVFVAGVGWLVYSSKKAQRRRAGRG